MAYSSVLFVVMVLVAAMVEAQPIPAPDIPTQCNSIERCCMPTPYTGTPGVRAYDHHEPGSLPWRTRRPVHLLTEFEISRLENAYTLLRALPDTDPRSLLNQMNLHCLYCDNALHYPGQKYPLEIHNGWFFLPWHRMYLFWHERILAKLLDDDTFSLPYWAWDNTMDTDPLPNALPVIYANPNSALWNPNRNRCSAPPLIIDLDTRGGGCTTKTAAELRVRNDRLMYTQLVLGAPTPSLMFGMPYRFGDWGGAGTGTLEDQPHGPVYAWVGNSEAQPPLKPMDDMGNFGRAAGDPVFYPHHCNIDRMWDLWTKLPGGTRTFPSDPDFNISQLTFYDENANLVKMNVSQVLDKDLLKYKYEELETPWITNGVRAGEEGSIDRCSPMAPSAVSDLISATSKHTAKQVLTTHAPITFRVERPPRDRDRDRDQDRQGGGTSEVLELSDMHLNNTQSIHWKVYLFFPHANASHGPECPEYLGSFKWGPHPGQAAFNPKRVWRGAIGPKLLQLGLQDCVDEIVVTMVQTSKPPSGQNFTFATARVYYEETEIDQSTLLAKASYLVQG